MFVCPDRQVCPNYGLLANKLADMDEITGVMNWYCYWAFIRKDGGMTALRQDNCIQDQVFLLGFAHIQAIEKVANSSGAYRYGFWMYMYKDF